MESIQTQIFRVDPDAPDAEIIRQAAQILQAGGLVAFPTETVYGLGANALDARAVSRIYHAKGRPSNNPLIVHVPDVEGGYVGGERVAGFGGAAGGTFLAWPTYARSAEKRGRSRRGDGRRPNGGGASSCASGGAGPAAGGPRSRRRAERQPLPATVAHAGCACACWSGQAYRGGFGRRTTWGGLESTVLNLTTKRPTLLRPGLISPAEIEAVIGPISRRAPVPKEGEEANAPLPAPGLLSRHYAPHAPLEIVSLAPGACSCTVRQCEVVGLLPTGTAYGRTP